MSEKQNPLLIPLAAVAVVLVIVTGCVWFVWLRTTGADVRGQVTLDGDPVVGAMIVFIGQDAGNKSPMTAQSDDEGNYRVVGNTGPRIPPGKYKVVVTKEALKDGKVPTGEALIKARNDGLLVNVLPKKYELESTTPLEFDVTSGGNTINLELKK